MKIMVILHNNYVFACENIGKTQKKAAMPMGIKKQIINTIQEEFL